MADQHDLEKAFAGLTRDITSRLHRPSPASLTRRARQHRSRRQLAAATTAAVIAVVGAWLLPTALLSAGDHRPASTGPPDSRTGSTPPQHTAMSSETCTTIDTSTEDVITGVTLTWDSSFRCVNAPREGTYQFTGKVTNTASSEAVTLDSLQLTHTTPRPGGQGPAATGETTQLPLTLEPGTTTRVTVHGTYQLVHTGDGAKANLHFIARGRGTHSAERLSLGINAHLRAPGTAAEATGPGRSSG